MAGYVLESHVQALLLAYDLTVHEDMAWIIAHGFRLPPGFNHSTTDILVELPPDYPLSPPGVGDAHVYVDPDLRYRGRQLRDVHTYATPGWGHWAWFCFERIDWDASRDDLLGFLEMIRADLTAPPTK